MARRGGNDLLSFGAGVVGSEQGGRVDMRKTQGALRTASNFIVEPYGSLRRRPGLQFMGLAGETAFVDTEPFPAMVLTNYLYGIEQFSNGHLLLAGAFESIDGGAQSYVSVVDANGNISTLNDVGLPSVGAQCCAIVDRGSTGWFVAGGNFTTVSEGAVTRQRVAAFNRDLTLRSSFGDPEINGFVHALAVQADGKILAGGDFTTVGGVSCPHLCRLNQDGSRDATFPAAAPSHVVYGITVLPDGRIALAGGFETIGATARTKFAILAQDGTLDSWAGPTITGSGRSIQRDSTGRFLLGGQLVTVGGVDRGRVVRVSSTGTLDTGWTPDVQADEVRSVALTSTDNVIVCGAFVSAGGIAADGLACLNSTDGDFVPGWGGGSGVVGVDGSAYVVKVFPGGAAFIGGDFLTFGVTGRVRIAKFSTATGELYPEI